MKEEIIRYLDQPAQLEHLYRKNPSVFRQEFNTVYPEFKKNQTAQIWNERLNFKQEEPLLANKNEFIFVLFAVLFAGLIAKIPDFTGISPDWFFPRNIGFIVFPMLTAFFLWRQKLSGSKLIFPILTIVLAAFYINLLPNQTKSDTLMLACIHLPLLLWTVLGYSFLGNDLNSKTKRIDFLRFNGDLLVMCAVLALSGALFTGITFGLFELIGIRIEEFYAKYVIVFAAPAIPILGTYLVQNNPQLVNKISPIIARIFTPLVLIMLSFFLGAMLITGKDPYNDREFLLIFNILLIGVMALILFSVSEATKGITRKLNLFLLLGLAVLTIVLNGIALSAIAFRLFEFGITPNRLAVIGANLLIFINLIWVASKLFFVIKGKSNKQQVERVIAVFIPVYGIWAALVTFLLPLLFSFK